MFLAGLTVVALGVLGLARSSGIGPRLRRGVTVVTAAGAAAALTTVGLAGTARQNVPGSGRDVSGAAAIGMQDAWIIPALHDAATDRPVPYTPVCAAATVPVCIHPVFRKFLPDVTAALGPVLRELAGLPGAPVRAGQVASGSLAAPSGTAMSAGPPDGALSGTPPVFWYTTDQVPAGAFAQTRSTFVASLKGALVAAFVPTKAAPAQPGGSRTARAPARAVLAQVAVREALLQVAGVPVDALSDALGPADVWLPRRQQAQVDAAAQRLAALPAAARHPWLASHLASLRAGHLALAQLP
jgi:hypothetical protein